MFKYLQPFKMKLNMPFQNNMFKYALKAVLVIVLIVFLYIIGCSQTYFSSLATVSCEDFGEAYDIVDCSRGDGNTVVQNDDNGNGYTNENEDYPRQEPLAPQKNYVRYNYDIPSGKVDMIFIVDNSSSMNEEHKNLGRQFKDFLDDVKDLDYNIAIITTDISKSPKNPKSNQPYQDGKFIRIGGQMYIRNPGIGGQPPKHLVDNFKDTLERPETLACDNQDDSGSAYERSVKKWEGSSTTQQNAHCPSGDERGIYALNQAIDNSSHRSFFRKEAQLMAVIISDEDERSGAGYINDNPEYKFETYDWPEVLIQNVADKFGRLKNFSFHSIVTDTSRCLSDQNRKKNSGAGYGRGYIGKEYIRLSRAKDKNLMQYDLNLLRGSVISICSSKYGDQLSKIAEYANNIRASIPCEKPDRIIFKVDGRHKDINYDLEGRSLIIRTKINLRSKISLSVICEE